MIVFEFPHLDIEPEAGEYSSSCSRDYLEIFDGNNDDAILLRKYCALKSHGKQTSFLNQ